MRKDGYVTSNNVKKWNDWGVGLDGAARYVDMHFLWHLPNSHNSFLHFTFIPHFGIIYVFCLKMRINCILILTKEIALDLATGSMH